MEHYERISGLGRGSYGAIIKVRRRSDGLVCVIKQVSHATPCFPHADLLSCSQIPLEGLSTKELTESINEARVMSRIRLV